MARLDSQSILRWMEATPGAHSIRSIAEGMGVETSKIRTHIRRLEEQGALIRTTLDPIQFKLAGCGNVYADPAGANVRCTTRHFHEEHQVNGYKQLRVPVGKEVDR